MTKPKAIIFDCWNTLFYVRSQPTVFTRVARTALGERLTYPLTKRIERSLQLAPQADPERAAAKLLRDLHLPVTPILLRRMMRIITTASRHHAAYHDTLSTLDYLRGKYKLGLLTNTFEVSFQSLRRQFDLDKRFDVVLPSYETAMIKPDPELFKLMLERLGTKPEETVMVGDRYRDDIEGAEAAGIKGILVDRGNHHSRVSARIRELSELRQLLG